MSEHPTAQRILVAIGIAVTSIAVSLPDGAAGSPRAIAMAIGTALIGAGVYLGAAEPKKPEEPT